LTKVLFRLLKYSYIISR